MKSHWFLNFCFIPCSYTFVVVYFFPTVPTFAVFDFVAVFKAKAADYPGRVGKRCIDHGGTVGGAVIGSFDICGSIIGSCVIVCAGVRGDGRMSSWREVSQLDDDVFLPSNWITRRWVGIHGLSRRGSGIYHCSGQAATDVTSSPMLSRGRG
jgi:hypothetical protein